MLDTASEFCVSGILRVIRRRRSRIAPPTTLLVASNVPLFRSPVPVWDGDGRWRARGVDRIVSSASRRSRSSGSHRGQDRTVERGLAARPRQRAAFLSDRREQLGQAIPVVPHPASTKPTTRGTASSRKHRPGQRHAGFLRRDSLRVAPAESIPFVVPGRFGLLAMSSLRRTARSFTINYPWPPWNWCCVRTSNFHGGHFRGKINPP